MLQAPPCSSHTAPLTRAQENKRLAEEPPSLAQTCRQHEPRSALPGANLSCVMTKLFVPIAVHKHRYYSLRIHTTFNLLQYILLQSMIIFLHVSDFFPWLPKHLTSSSRLQKGYYGSVCVTLLFPRKCNRITQAVKWIQGPTINVLFPYYSVKLHLFYPFDNFWKGKLTEKSISADSVI